MDRKSSQIISKEAEELNNTIKQLELTNRTLHPTRAEYTLSSSAYTHSN